MTRRENAWSRCVIRWSRWTGKPKSCRGCGCCSRPAIRRVTWRYCWSPGGEQLLNLGGCGGPSVASGASRVGERIRPGAGAGRGATRRALLERAGGRDKCTRWPSTFRFPAWDAWPTAKRRLGVDARLVARVGVRRRPRGISHQRGRMRFQFGSTCLRISASSSRLRIGDLGVALAAARQLVVIELHAQAGLVGNAHAAVYETDAAALAPLRRAPTARDSGCRRRRSGWGTRRRRASWPSG